MDRKIPPTAVGGWFRSTPPTEAQWIANSNPRQLVDGSDPHYQLKLNGVAKSHQLQLVDGSGPHYLSDSNPQYTSTPKDFSKDMSQAGEGWRAQRIVRSGA